MQEVNREKVCVVSLFVHKNISENENKEIIGLDQDANVANANFLSSSLQDSGPSRDLQEVVRRVSSRPRFKGKESYLYRMCYGKLRGEQVSKKTNRNVFKASSPGNKSDHLTVNLTHKLDGFDKESMSFLMTDSNSKGVQIEYFDLKTDNCRDNEVAIARKQQTSSANKMLASSGFRVGNLGLVYESNKFNNEFVLALRGNMEYRKTVIRYLDAEREICWNKEGEQSREQHMKLANEMLAFQGVSHISFHFMNNNQDNGDMGRNYGVQDGASHRPKQ